MDAHERTRAILWCLADARPEMPLVEALGMLKAIEHRVEALELEAAQDAMAVIPGLAEAIKRYAAEPVAVSMATKGMSRELTQALRDDGCSPKEAMAIATSMINMLGPSTI